MAEKKVHETAPDNQSTNQADIPKEKMEKASQDVAVTVPMNIPAGPVVLVPQNRVPSIPAFSKSPPNDLYRRLLPAVLFLLTFVTVMTILLIYMDTVALGAQQFRLNMSQDYELANIPQDSSALVAFLRQLHLGPRELQPPPLQPVMTRNVAELDKVFGPEYNGTFIEILPSGGQQPTPQYLSAARGWRGVSARAAARDYLALRPATRALHACLSHTDHPREIAYHEPSDPHPAFSSRVLCLPVYTMLLAAECTACDYLLLGGPRALPALTHVPFDRTQLKVIEIRSTDAATRNQTTEFLQSKNYTLLASFDDSVMYKLRGFNPLDRQTVYPVGVVSYTSH